MFPSPHHPFSRHPSERSPSSHTVAPSRTPFNSSPKNRSICLKTPAHNCSPSYCHPPSLGTFTPFLLFTPPHKQPLLPQSRSLSFPSSYPPSLMFSNSGSSLLYSAPHPESQALPMKRGLTKYQSFPSPAPLSPLQS